MIKLLFNKKYIALIIGFLTVFKLSIELYNYNYVEKPATVKTEHVWSVSKCMKIHNDCQVMTQSVQPRDGLSFICERVLDACIKGCYDEMKLKGINPETQPD